jgi:outer membrane lipoprotein-sorting protein
MSLLTDTADAQGRRRQRNAEAQSAPAEKPAQIATKLTEGTRVDAGKVIENHPLLPAIKIAKSSQEKLKSVKDYTAVFTKRERIKNRVIQQTMDLKFREEPFSIYLKFQPPYAPGREVLYIDGQNSGKLLAHESGLKSIAGTIALAPNSPDAMFENRHPVTELGLAKMLDLCLEQWESETQYEECEVKYYNEAKLGTTECLIIESTHAQARPHFKFHRTRLFLDKKSNLPVRVEQYGFPDRPGVEAPLIEEYTYSALQINPGLSDRDFDRRNPGYAFR